jgi:selenium-binding protein 1
MEIWRPDPTLYPSPRMAVQAPPERLAFGAMPNVPSDGRPML